MATILVTGSSGFIGSKTSQFLLEEGNTVVGIDNMNDYYDVRLKQNRLKSLAPFNNFQFHNLDIENISGLEKIFSNQKFDAIINLAARAGVRYRSEERRVGKECA